MLKTLTLGLMLLMTFSCSTVIKEPQPVYVINTKLMSVAYGKKSLNVQGGASNMGEWIDRPQLIDWSEIPENLIGFPLKIWLEQIKPVLKEQARKYDNQNSGGFGH